jgi:hypothetical protein
MVDEIVILSSVSVDLSEEDKDLVYFSDLQMSTSSTQPTNTYTTIKQTLSLHSVALCYQHAGVLDPFDEIT